MGQTLVRVERKFFFSFFSGKNDFYSDKLCLVQVTKEKKEKNRDCFRDAERREGRSKTSDDLCTQERVSNTA